MPDWLELISAALLLVVVAAFCWWAFRKAKPGDRPDLDEDSGWWHDIR